MFVPGKLEEIGGELRGQIGGNRRGEISPGSDATTQFICNALADRSIEILLRKDVDDGARRAVDR
jgi:hypothetical protein